MLTLVEQKAGGQEPDLEAAPWPADNVTDLMSALQEGIDRARHGRRSGRKRTTRQGQLDIGRSRRWNAARP